MTLTRIIIFIFLIISLVGGFMFNGLMNSLEDLHYQYLFSFKKFCDDIKHYTIKTIFCSMSGAESILSIIMSVLLIIQRFINNYKWRTSGSKDYVNFSSNALNFLEAFLTSSLALFILILLSYWLYKEIFPHIRLIYVYLIKVILYIVSCSLFINFMNVFFNMFHHTCLLVCSLILFAFICLYPFNYVSKNINNNSKRDNS